MSRAPWIHRAVARLRGEQSIQQLLAYGLDSTGNFFAGRGVYIDAAFAWAVTIGERVTLAPDVLIIAHDAASKHVTGYTAVRPVIIGDRAYVGSAAIILPGVTIGSDCVIGAGAVVPRDVPDGMVAVGNPARVVGSVAVLKQRHHERIAATARRDVRPLEATPLERQELRAALLEHGTVYVR